MKFRLITSTILCALIIGFSSVSYASGCEPILVKVDSANSEVYVTLRNINGAFKHKGEYYILLKNGATLVVQKEQFQKILAKVKEVY